MRNKLFGILGKSTLPALLAGAVLAFSSPAGALAAEGHGGGRAPARSFAGGERGFHGVDRGAREYRGGDWHGYRGGGVYVAPYAYGPAYGYAPVPAPCGYYDQFGYWHADPNCYLPY